MTNATPGLLTPEQEGDLVAAYRAVRRLAEGCEVPAVRAAVLAAEAELRLALDGQDLDCDYYVRPGRPPAP
ncbi:DUF6052 family protein [Streptomyces spiramenti]|uniref:DUF5133 domain-containing protein n=1 Tax=Streptomyces spiramenti TaxID=2720606 RepID=A0ABX1AKN3_9ACTN|nr:DUF6052 family protein [Streptomyces spiramenti]NJP65938.1 hypothetical protein [Streptomyces spiramenti]